MIFILKALGALCLALLSLSETFIEWCGHLCGLRKE